MKRALFWLPIIALGLFALGLTVELSERDDEIEHFQFATEHELKLELPSPFGTSRLGGTLTGSRGETLDDAVVYIRTDSAPFWNRTDTAGHFELNQLPSGPWEVLVVARGYQPQTFDIADDSTARTLVMQTPIVRLPTLPQLVRGTLSGALIDPNLPEANLAGYELSFEPEASLEDPSAPFPVRVLTDEKGAFFLKDLAEGRYRVHVHPPWARGGIWPDLCAPEATDFAFDPKLGMLTLTVPIERGEIHGRLTDSKGSFLEGALVIVESADDSRRVWPTVSTSREGSFLVTDLPPGAYRVRARAGAGGTEQLVDVQAGLTLNLDLDPLVTRAPEVVQEP